MGLKVRINRLRKRITSISVMTRSSSGLIDNVIFSIIIRLVYLPVRSAYELSKVGITLISSQPNL